MNDFYLTAYAIAFGVVFAPSAVLYVVLRHFFAGAAPDDEGREETDAR